MNSEPRKRRRDWRPPAGGKVEGLSSSNGSEIEQGLAAAELLLREALDERRHAHNRRTGAIALLTALVPALGVLVALVESAGVGRVFAVTLTILGLFATGLLASFLLRWPPEAESARLRVALQLAAMIGDVYLEIARREQWSYFRVEATRLRLSAFPLDPQRVSAQARVGKEEEAFERR